MMRKLTVLAALIVAAPAGAAPEGDAAAEAAAPAENGKSVLVLPYQPIYRSVAQQKAQTATDLLNKELSTKDGIVVIRGAIAEQQKTESSLDAANELMGRAEQAEAERRIEDAIKLRKQSIAAMEKNAGAITDADELILAHHFLARAAMWSARDKEAKATLEVAARMDPNLEIPADQFSRLYRAWFKRAAEKVMRERPGMLLVKSTLPGAKISMDGREMDVAPVLLKKAIPGKHLIIAEVEGVPPAGAIVEIKSSGKAEYTVQFSSTMGGDAVGAVAEAVAQNELPKKAVASAVKAGREASARFVVLGGMAKGDDHFRVHTFVVDVDRTSVKPLDVVNFDLDLLTAESDVIRIVRGIEGTLAGFTGGQNHVKRIEKKISAQSTINEVIAAPTLERTKKIRRDKDGKRRVFRALKGGTIKIKDEEE